MSGKGGIAALRRVQEASERRRSEAETEGDYLQDGFLAEPAASPDRHVRPSKPEPALKAAGDRVHTSVYLPRDLRRRLREIAAAEECKVHDLILEGVRHVVDQRAISA
jgi:hypothetical protein